MGHIFSKHCSQSSFQHQFLYFLGLAQHKGVVSTQYYRGLLSPTSTGDITAALTVASVLPHSTSLQKGVGVHKAHMLFRVGELVYAAVADLALLPANPGPDCCCCIPVCSTKTLYTPLYYHHLCPESAAFLCHYPPTFTVSQHQLFPSSLCRP